MARISKSLVWVAPWAALLVVAVAVWKQFVKTKEPFLYRVNPCGGHRSCKACAGAAGCGWCGDKKVCMPMAQDGFPQRRLDDSTAACQFRAFLTERERVECEMSTATVLSQRPVCDARKYVIWPERCV